MNLCEQPFEPLDLFGDNVTGLSLFFFFQMIVFIEASDGLRIKSNTCMLKEATVKIFGVLADLGLGLGILWSIIYFW